MKLRTIIAASIVLVHPCLADEASIQLEQANQSYRVGEYRKAAELYEQIVAGGYESPALYYNLGNAYFKLKNNPAAILNYERAKRLAPADDDIAYNLRIAQLRTIDRIEPLPELFFFEWWNALLDLNTADTWGTYALAAFWCGLFAAGSLWLIRRNVLRRTIEGVIVLSVVVCAVSSLGALHRFSVETSHTSAIVFTPTVSVKSAPDKQSTDLFVLHEGVKLQMLDVLGDWTRIRLSDGKTGWLPAESFRAI